MAAGSLGTRQNLAARHFAELKADGVEECLMRDFKSELAQARRELGSEGMDTFRDRTKTVRTMINRVHRRHDSEEDLRRANIARRFIATDVLLARLHCETISRATVDVVGDAHETSRHVTPIFVARCEKCRVRTAEHKWHTEALRVPNRHIGDEFSRRF